MGSWGIGIVSKPFSGGDFNPILNREKGQHRLCRFRQNPYESGWFLPFFSKLINNNHSHLKKKKQEYQLGYLKFSILFSSG